MRFGLTRPDGRLSPSKWQRKLGDLMGKHARIGLLLGASACLLAVMVDWVVEELDQHGNPRAGN
jgi:hypothetical protein